MHTHELDVILSRGIECSFIPYQLVKKLACILGSILSVMHGSVKRNLVGLLLMTDMLQLGVGL